VAGSTTNIPPPLLLNKHLILKIDINSLSDSRSRYHSRLSVTRCVVPDVLKDCSASVFRDKQYEPTNHSRRCSFRLLGITCPKAQCHIHCDSHKIPRGVSYYSNNISLMKQHFVLTPHDLWNWDTHVTRVSVYETCSVNLCIVNKIACHYIFIKT